MKDFIEGFLQGCRETPRGFFAPLIVVWQLLKAAAETVPDHSKKDPLGR
jgi:hypothetical protein